MNVLEKFGGTPSAMTLNGTLSLVRCQLGDGERSRGSRSVRAIDTGRRVLVEFELWRA